PAAIGAADPERAVLREGEAVDARLEAFAERGAGALPGVADLLERDAHHRRDGLVADEDLAAERSELAAGLVDLEVARALAHADVGEPDRGRRDLGNRIVRLAAGPVDEARLVAVEAPERHGRELVRRHVIALIV